MKPEEAISAIKNNMPTKGTYTILTEALELAIQALEKQVGRKLKDYSVIDGFYSREAYERLIKVCRDFGNPYLRKYDKYCGECGQRIWWGE